MLKRTLILSLLLTTAGSLIPAGNLVRNGGFNVPGSVTSPQPPLTIPDDRLPGWTMSGQWHVDKNQESPIPETQVFVADAANGAPGYIRQDVYLEPGETYTLSAWIKAEGLKITAPRIGDARSGIFISNWNWSETVWLVDATEYTSEWKRYTRTFQAPKAYQIGGVNQPCRVRIFLPRGEEGKIWATGIQIEKGSSVSDFKSISSVEKDELQKQISAQISRLDEVKFVLKQFDGDTARQQEAEISNAQKHISAFLQKLDRADQLSISDWHQLAQQSENLIKKVNSFVTPLVWWENPWLDLPERVLPADSSSFSQKKIRVTVAQNDYAAALLPISNRSMQSIAVEVVLGNSVAPLSTLSVFDDVVNVSSVRRVSHEGLNNIGGGVSFGQQHKTYPYFLETLGNGNTVLLPALETSQIWFDIDSRDLKPGIYRYPVRLKGLVTDFIWDGEIEIEVLPVQLPERVPANVIAYASMPFYMPPFSPHSSQRPILDYTPEERLEIARPWLDTWKDMGFNRLMLTTQYLKASFDEEGELAEPIDYSVFDAYQELWSSIGADFYGAYNLATYHIYSSWRDNSKLIPSELAYKKTKSLFQSLVEHARSRGMTPDSFPICMFDEPHGPRVPITHQGVNALKEVDPEWKVISTIVGTEAAHIRALIPYIDIFVVRQRMGQMDMNAEGIKELQRNGKEVWGYACSGSFEYLNPYRYYRLLSWQAWNNGLSGYGVYMSIDAPRYPEIGARSAAYSPLFLGREGPVMGKGARAFQLGGRDWCIFTLAQERIESLREEGKNAQATELEKKLSQTVQAALKDEQTPALADQGRAELLRALIQ